MKKRFTGQEIWRIIMNLEKLCLMAEKISRLNIWVTGLS